MHRSASPYRPPSRAHSPYSPQGEAPYAAMASLPTGPAQVGPGAITYTTSQGPDGRVIYHPFKAVSASYQTPSGIISGIQWIPAEATTTMPVGGIPAANKSDYPAWPGNDFARKEEPKSTQEWERADEKRRRQEEKEAKRLRGENHGRNDADYEIQMARERDTLPSGSGRERRKSFVGGASPRASVVFPGGSEYPTHPSHSGTAQTGYPSSPYQGHSHPAGGYAASGGHNRHASAAQDLARQMDEMEINNKRERKVSFGGHVRKPSAKGSPYERARTISGNHGDPSNPYPSPPSTYTPYTYPKHAASPNIRPSDIPQGYGTAGSTGYPSSKYSPVPDVPRSSSPFGPPPGGYPPGHILYDGQSRSRGPSRPVSRSASRAPSPNPGGRSQGVSPMMGGRSPHIPMAMMPGEPQQLPAPEAFSRPINASNSFAPFEARKVLDMDDIYDSTSYLPKMPAYLSTHDIYPDDWKRCMQDLARSWIGQLPVAGMPDGKPPRKSKLAQDLVELWNNSFYMPRGVELVLYKGRERRTGPQAGLVEPRLFDDDDDSSTTTSDDSSDYDNSSRDRFGRPAYNAAEVQERRREKAEKRQRRQARKEKRRAKAYTVFVTSIRAPVASQSHGSSGMPGAFPSGGPSVPGPSAYNPPPAGYGPPPTGYGSPHAGFAPPAGYGPPTGYPTPPAPYGAPGSAYSTPFNPPVGIPMTRSHGGGY
ncbi:hypothetical protein CPB83DRAFT_901872 [Crepidotus variabilis]|uniref:Uncharacterized protein n=1 Tax=Crepidotus variabilis TaxID=179855 RepID=A0A9P6JWR7_9AGAR|nr:hypothetical protein CPB83DRAFT_901872 [Crepidotus variabilis]